MKFIPETPRHGANVSETKLFDALAAHGVNKDWIAIHSVVIGRDPDVIVGEADFYVLIPARESSPLRQKRPLLFHTKLAAGF